MAHYPGHLREAFTVWVEDGMPDTAAVEVNYEEECWPSERLLGLMWHCSDIMPGYLCQELEMEQGSTYAQAAQYLHRRDRSALA